METTGPSDTIPHIHAGMACWVVARVILGRSLASPWALLMVYLAELTGEVLDDFAHEALMPDTLKDEINTVFWPTVLFIGSRVRPLRAG